MTPEANLDFFKNKVALVVEDNAANFMLLARLLQALGIGCEWKSSGFEVLEFSKTMTRLDIILLDIHLPYEDGYSALRNIRSAENLKMIPVVAITADVSTDSMAKAQKAGFNGFIGKPIDPDRFPDQLYRVFTGTGVWEMY
ncbi:MAG: response regulator [Anaerolineaceae bacterium]|nr:response regulator [Anaerolineaceae bacterium]